MSDAVVRVAVLLLQGAPLPDPGYLSGFDHLGPAAILVGAIFGGAFVVVWLIHQFRSGNLVTDIRHREAIELKDEQIASSRKPSKTRSVSTQPSETMRSGSTTTW